MSKSRRCCSRGCRSSSGRFISILILTIALLGDIGEISEPGAPQDLTVNLGLMHHSQLMRVHIDCRHALTLNVPDADLAIPDNIVRFDFQSSKARHSHSSRRTNLSTTMVLSSM